MEKPAAGSSNGRGKVMLGKPGVTSMAYAAGHCSGETQLSLHMQQVAIMHYVGRPIQTCCLCLVTFALLTPQ